MTKLLVVASALALVLPVVGSAVAQPLGNVPLLTPPVPPSAVIERFGSGPALNTPAPGRPATTTRPSTIANTPGRPSTTAQPSGSGPTVSAQEQKPLVCQTIGYRTVCE